MATQPNFATVEPPPHVPADHIFDFDYFHPAGLAEGDIYTALKRLHAWPDLFWTPRNGGHWVSTRADDITRPTRAARSVGIQQQVSGVRYLVSGPET